MAAEDTTSSLSRVSIGTRVSGKVEFGELARIEGEAEGEISGDIIVIAPSAKVTARIAANCLTIGGQVNGEIIARERVELLSTARLRCTITTPTLVVNEGAEFEGDCKMPQEPKRSRQSQASAPQPESIRPESESGDTKATGVSFFITRIQKAELHERGYSDEDIAQMLPGVAHRILGIQ